jgi:hypothetical protein
VPTRVIVLSLNLLLLLCGSFLSLPFSANNNDLLAETPLESAVVITQSSDQILENSLRALFSGEFGYVLLGAKPASIAECSDYYLCTHPEARDLLLQFLKNTFKGSTNFIVKAITDGKCYRIEFINKQAVRQVVLENYELQLFIDTKFRGLNNFFESLGSVDTDLFGLFEDPFLIGLVLGYGRANSEYYCRRCVVGEYLKRYPVVCQLPFNPEPHKSYAVSQCFDSFSLENVVKEVPVTKGFWSLADEWSWIREVFWNLEDDCSPAPPYYISLPFYICRHGGDSEQVRDKYLKARDCLADLLYRHSFKEVVFEEASRGRFSGVSG